MDLRKLAHAVALARHMSFTKAAQTLNLTQPALSRSIQALEAECRVRLFDRDNGSVSVTQAGYEFLRHAETVLRHHGEMRTALEQIAHGKGGRVAIGMTPVAARILLEPLLGPHLAQPHFQASVVVEGERRLLRLLAEESLDFCVCSDPDVVTHDALSSMELARLPLAMLVRRNHPLTRITELKASDIEHYPLIRSRPFTHDDTGPIIVGPSRIRPPAVTVEDYEVLERLAINTEAVWVTTALASKEPVRRGDLVALPTPWLARKPSTILTAYRSRERTLSPLTRRLLEQVVAISADLRDF